MAEERAARVKTSALPGKQGKRKAEILAPVGGREQLLAALRCGADAVYFGLPDFNARRNADNFTAEELPERVADCHERGVRVYLTLNTLIKDSERGAMERSVDAAAEAGADALIVQDLAVARYAKAVWPSLALHASTQTAAHNSAGVLELLDFGFQRIVLARELSLAEIRAICEKTGAEIEVFVHGAHCMSVSGYCYLSALIGGRSGNRGLCAQPCRLDWKLEGRDHALSLKDLSYLHHLQTLAEAGVCSFKIEGRMKRPEYVAAAVTACRAALEGRAFDEETLRAVFSRSGFTDGHLQDRRDASMFGIRTKEDVQGAPAVLKELERLYQKEPQTLPVDMCLELRAGEAARLTARCGESAAEVCGALPQENSARGIDEAYARRSLEKTGGTPYYLRTLTLDAGEALMLSGAQLNALRRDALAALRESRTRVSRARREAPAPSPAPRRPAETALRLRFARAAQIFPGAAEGTEAVILPAEEILRHPELAERYGAQLWAELPALLWEGSLPAFEKDLEQLRALGIRHALAENIGALRQAREAGFAVHGGAFLNVLNSAAAEAYRALGLQDLTLSFENSFDAVRKMRTQIPFGLLTYGSLPLMKFRACPGKAAGGCRACGGVRTLRDRTGADFRLLCREKQYSELLNCVPLYTADRLRPPLDFETLYFTAESGEACAEIAEACRDGRPIAEPHTAGLYFRKLL